MVPRNATAIRPEQFAGQDGTPVRETSSDGIGEGLGVFRALFFMLVVYISMGFLFWFAWHAWRWHAH